MIVTSRSAAEYRAMFGLPEPAEAELSILDCSAGASSFAAESPARVVAVDPVYAKPHHELAADVETGLREGDRIIAANAGRFDWSWYGDQAARTRMRVRAAQLFLGDVRRSRRYVAGALPNLPFAARSFDVVLCSHLLFTWSDVLPLEWHRRAFADLVRVARREIRVFPLVLQGVGTPVRFLGDLRAELDAAGCSSEVRTVAYRFQRDADQMLLVRPR